MTTGEGPVEYEMSVSEGGGTVTLATPVESADLVVSPVPTPYGHGAVINGTQLQSSRLVLFLVANAVIAGLAAAVLLAAFEIVVHLLP